MMEAIAAAIVFLAIGAGLAHLLDAFSFPSVSQEKPRLAAGLELTDCPPKQARRTALL